MMAKCILVSPSQRGRCLWWIISKIVKDRIRLWNAGDFASLWSDVITAEVRMCSRGRRKASSESQLVHNVRRACRAVEEGQYRKAIQLLSFRGLVQASDEVSNEMLAKHPQLGCNLRAPP